MPFVNLTAQRNAYRTEFESAEKAVFDSGCYVGGAQVASLEAELAEFCGSKHVISCGSGTDALTIALKALGLRPGDQVIVPDFTFIAPAESVALLGGTPIFADIDNLTLQISPESIEKQITSNTKGIIAVNLFGQCAPFEALRKIADRHGLWLLEDSAQAFGATRDGKHACTLGDIGITSFYPSKPLGCYGDGGAIFTDNDELATKMRQIANHGCSAHYLHETIGVNSRLDAIQAAVLRVKLRHLTAELEQRRKNAQMYNEFFAAIEGFVPQRLDIGNQSTYAQYTLLAHNRDAFIEKLKLAETPYCIHYPRPLHQQPCFLGTADDIEISNSYAHFASTKICQKVISLPVCAFTDVPSIINKLRSIL